MAEESSVVFIESAERYRVDLKSVAHRVSERLPPRPDGAKCKAMSVGETEKEEAEACLLSDD